MSKFDPLTKYLEKSGKENIVLTFSEIEHILSEKLCPSAHKYSAYWHLSKTHTLPLAVECADYTIDSVDLQKETVRIKKKF